MTAATLLLVAVASFAPGFLFYRRFLQNRDDTAAAMLSGSFVCAIFLISGMAFVSFLLGRPPARTNAILYLAAILGFGWSGQRSSDARWLAPLGAFLLFDLVVLQILMLIPSYQAAYTLDWSLYYPNIDVYLGRISPHTLVDPVRFEYIVKRTPFFSLFNTFFLSGLGRSYVSYQIVSLFLNSLIFWPVFAMATRFYRKRVGKLMLLLLPITPLVLFSVVIPTPKSVAAFCFLTAALAYLRAREALFDPAQRRRLSLCVLASSTAFMVHPSGLFYVSVLAIDQMVLRVRRRRPIPWRALTIALVLAAVLIAPWFGWAAKTFGIDRLLVPTNTISEQHPGVGDYLRSRLLMIATTAVLPQSTFQVLRDWGTEPFSEWFVTLQNPLVRFYWETFLGGMTISATILGLLRARRRLPPGMTRIVGWAAAGALFCLAIDLMVDAEGQAANIMAPLAIAWFVTLWGFLGAAARWVVRVAVVGTILESIGALLLVVVVTSREEKVFVYLSDVAGPHHTGAIAFALALTATAAAYALSIHASIESTATPSDPDGAP